MPAPLISTADAKIFLRVFHSVDDTLIASLVTAVVAEWERVTHTALTASTQYSHIYAAAPDDGVLRVWYQPPLAASVSIAYTNAAGAPATGGVASHWDTLDGYSQYIISDDEAAAWTYPVTITYTTGQMPKDVEMALLLRIGFFYSYRGDDVNPPDQGAWKMLVARHRTGALL